MTCARAEPECRYAVPRWRMPLIAAVGVLTSSAGYGLVAAGVWLLTASWWWTPLVFIVGIAGGAFALVGVSCLGLTLWFGVTRAAGRRVVRVAPDGLWVWRPFGWWSRFVPFASVAWVKREQPKPDIDSVWIVHGPTLVTETVNRGAIRPADYEALLALLGERCPHALTPDPPAGWRPPVD